MRELEKEYAFVAQVRTQIRLAADDELETSLKGLQHQNDRAYLEGATKNPDAEFIALAHKLMTFERMDREGGMVGSEIEFAEWYQKQLK